MKLKVVIAGGTGFIGNYLTEKFTAAGHNVAIISRKQSNVRWKNKTQVVAALEGADLLINLAGKSVNCSYTKHNMQTIVNSRVETTRLLGEAILKCKTPPKLWINSSTATIYRHAEDRPMTESNGEIGAGFSVNVARRWERAFFSFTIPETRMIALRTAIVLGKKGGALPPYKNLVNIGMGGHQGSGKQMFSWIHEEDLYKIICFLQSNKQAKGVYNCAAPNPIPNKVFMSALRKTMHVKYGLPCPEFLLKVGASIIKTETELVLKSRWVLPERLLDEGFEFKYPTIENALDNIIHAK